MYSVKENKKKERIIKKSKFISFIYRLEKEEDIEVILKEKNEQYKDATHCCYAYIYENKIKMSDDNEPSGTAGNPILDVLKKNHLDHVLCIVIRYFGGIKLGAGGLIRAYSTSCKEVVENNIIELIEGYKIKINTSYEKIKEMDYLLKDEEIIKKEYNDKIEITVKVKKETLEKLKSLEQDICLIENTYIEKKL